MPIWGFSALVASSVGASLSGAGQAIILSPTAPALTAKEIAGTRRFQPLPTKPIEPAIPRIVASAEAGLVRPYRSNTGLGRTAHLTRRPENMGSAKPSPDFSAVAGPVPVVAAGPVNVADRGGIAVGNGLPAVSVKPAASITNAAAAAVPNLAPKPTAAGKRAVDGLALYGTSAQNAYKVYFPQADVSAPGAGDDSPHPSPETDARVLTKQGSYLIYADAKNEPSNGVKSGLEASGMSENQAVLDAIASATKDAKPKELTAPPLQKQPLNFGDKELEPSPRSLGGAGNNAAGKSNAE